jgi:pimeloyl-ACP methyl ester carboxylesterase
MRPRFLYLHGFASSPASRKARLFVERLRDHGICLEALDLAPDLQNLTLTGQLAVVEDPTHGQNAVLIGSSMGGYLAALYAAAHPQSVERLVLLAPAFDFYQLWAKKLGPAELEQWRTSGTTRVYHYGMGQETLLGFALMEDAERYPGFPDVQQPCLVLHGLQDVVVPFQQSLRFAAVHPSTTKLVSLDSDHELTNNLNEIWNHSKNFLLGANIG